MPTPVRRHLVQWLLLCAVALGVVGMHHLATGADAHGVGTAAATSHEAVSHAVPVRAEPRVAVDAVDAVSPASPMGGHDLWHLCMAVLGSTVAPMLLLALMALMALTAACDSPTVGLPRRWRVPRPRGGGTILTLVGVLRL